MPRFAFSTRLRSFWVAIFGAALVSVSSIVGTIWLQDIGNTITEAQYNIDYLVRKREKYWRDFSDLEQQVFRATLLLGHHMKEVDRSRNKKNFFGGHAQNAISHQLDMSKAAISYAFAETKRGCTEYKKNPARFSAKTPERASLIKQTCKPNSKKAFLYANCKSYISSGSLSFSKDIPEAKRYSEMYSRIKCARALYNAATVLSDAYRTNHWEILSALKKKYRQIQYTQTMFTLIGLVFVLLKDLPIWRDTIERKKVGL